MKQRRDELGLDDIDRRILVLLQEDCKVPLAKIGEKVGLSAPSVVDRVRKLESEGFITGYHAQLDARRLGMDITAFIGVSIGHTRGIAVLRAAAPALAGRARVPSRDRRLHLVAQGQDARHAVARALIRSLRSIEGVERTETSVVLSTKIEAGWAAHHRRPRSGRRCTLAAVRAKHDP